MSRFRLGFLSITAIVVTILVSGCSKQPAEPPDTRAADEAAIRAAVAAWSKASQAKDVNAAVAVYADNALQFADKGPLVTGKDNIRKGWEQMLALQGPGLTFSTTGVEVARSGDLAYEYGTYDFATQDKKGKVTDEKGKYVAVWKKQADGSWKVVADIDNQDAAPGPPSAPAKKKSTVHKKHRRHAAAA